MPPGLPLPSTRSVSDAMRTHTVVPSPVGHLTLVAEGGALAAVHPDGARHAPDPATLGERDGDGLSQAVGAAKGRIPLGIVVPCHRVVGAGGALVGYAGGLDSNRFPLALEQSEQTRATRLS